jgi:hypothetical protein
MKKSLFTLIFFSFIFSPEAQVATSILQYNDVSALLRNDGILFMQPGLNIAAYEVPSNSGKKSIYAHGLWCAVIDDSNNIRLAAMRYSQVGKDFFPGPVSSTNSYNDSLYLTNYSNSMWSVLAGDVAFHQANFWQTGYVMSPNIQNWPANGVSGLGVSPNLAPFVDNNGNGIYEPMLGDYPDIRGDQATYVIMNDVKSVHTESGGLPLGIEVHLMAYQYFTTDYRNRTTFLNYRIFNRSSSNYTNFKLGQFTDFDLGNSSDDFVGCDSNTNLMYVYNADNDDSGFSYSYGVNPPAAGLVALNHNMSNFSYFNNFASFPYADPSAPSHYYNFMSGGWADGSSWYYGGTGAAGSVGSTNIQTKYLFPGNPNDPSSWNEVSAGNAPGDRRGVMTVEDVNLPAGGSACYDFAVLYAREAGNNNLQNVNALITQAALAKTDYDAMNFSCNQITLGLDQLDETQIGLFPNPTTGAFTISFGNEAVSGILTVTDMNGRIVLQENLKNVNTKSFRLESNTGVYYVSIKTERGTVYKKLIVTE